MTGKFIVIEGLDATGKSTLVGELAESLKATLLRCPPKLEAPEFIDSDLRSYFDERPAVQRRAYYRAANLIASEQAEAALQSGHVVMDRYWTSTVAFAALDDDSNLDEEWHGCYPPEFCKPDIVILLTVDEENRAKRMQERGEPVTAEEHNLAEDAARRETVLRVYRTFDPIEIDTSNLTPDAVLETVLAVLHRPGLC
jgi:thymidylate kinase